MTPYLTVSYTNLSPEAHLPTPRHGQYLTDAPNHIRPAVTAMDSCLFNSCFGEEETENEFSTSI